MGGKGIADPEKERGSDQLTSPSRLRMAGESPALATNTVFPFRRATVAVVPQESAKLWAENMWFAAGCNDLWMKKTDKAYFCLLLAFDLTQ